MQTEYRDRIVQVSLRVGAHPMLHVVAAFPIACFSAALVTDIAYVATENYIYADFSAWLLAGGMFMGVIAAFAGLVDLVRRRRVAGTGPHWPLVLGSLLVLVAAFFDNLVHSRDAWTSVMPEGLLLSAVTVVLMLGTAFSLRAVTIRRVRLAEGRV